jgi:hypothetical protein
MIGKRRRDGVANLASTWRRLVMDQSARVSPGKVFIDRRARVSGGERGF